MRVSMTLSLAAVALALIAVTACSKAPAAGGSAATDSGADISLAAPQELSAAAKAALLKTFPAPFNTADLSDGEAQFNKCRSCHTITSDKMNMTGPHLYGVFGRHSATAEGYTYSDAMQAHNVTWDFNTLDVYLKSPQTVVKGTKMGFMGIADDTKRRDLIAYLKVETTPPQVITSTSASASDSQ